MGAILLELYILGGTIIIETMSLEYGKFEYPILWFSTFFFKTCCFDIVVL